MWVIGNWKMYKTKQQASEYINALNQALIEEKIELSQEHRLGLAVPFTTLETCVKSVKGIDIGAQNMHEAHQGAFTGEIATDMIEETGASFVLIGHSERRKLFGETDERIAAKVKYALTHSRLQVVLCVGETLEEHEAGQTQQVIQNQLKSAMEGVSVKHLSSLAVAYEPVWAIGTGKVAKDKDIVAAHGALRESLVECYEQEGGKVAILYGGSVRLDHAEKLSQLEDVNGLLVGRACLEAESFAKLAKACFTSQG